MKKVFMIIAAMCMTSIMASAQKTIRVSTDKTDLVMQVSPKGTISGSELITKQEAGKYDGKYMSGSYLRPFTVEFSAGIKF